MVPSKTTVVPSQVWGDLTRDTLSLKSSRKPVFTSSGRIILWLFPAARRARISLSLYSSHSGGWRWMIWQKPPWKLSRRRKSPSALSLLRRTFSIGWETSRIGVFPVSFGGMFTVFLMNLESCDWFNIIGAIKHRRTSFKSKARLPTIATATCGWPDEQKKRLEPRLPPSSRARSSFSREMKMFSTHGSLRDYGLLQRLDGQTLIATTTKNSSPPAPWRPVGIFFSSGSRKSILPSSEYDI